MSTIINCGKETINFFNGMKTDARTVWKSLDEDHQRRVESIVIRALSAIGLTCSVVSTIALVLNPTTSVPLTVGLLALHLFAIAFFYDIGKLGSHMSNTANGKRSDLLDGMIIMPTLIKLKMKIG